MKQALLALSVHDLRWRRYSTVLVRELVKVKLPQVRASQLSYETWPLAATCVR